MNTAATNAIVEVDDLRIEDISGRSILNDISFSVTAGERLGIVGESGAGKTTLAFTLLGHLRPGLRLAAGSVRVEGRDILGLPQREMRAYRRTTISYLGQDPAAALTPSMRVADQVRELLHGNHSAEEARSRLEAVGLPGDDGFSRRYPHEVSGGQLQRVAIARALAPDPSILVLDEPTASIDLITRRLILQEIERQADLLGITLVMVSHDLNMVARTADRLLVLRDGEVVEHGEAAATLSAPAHPYTCELVAACDGNSGRAALEETQPESMPALTVRGLVAGYGHGDGYRRIVDDVDLEVQPRECMALVGVSGVGKSTIARCLLGLHQPQAGTVSVAGQELAPKVTGRSAPERRSIQLVPQDPEGSLNPRRRVGDTLRHALCSMRGFGRRDAEHEAATLMERVRLSPALLDRFPRELSGGERQRIAIARALAAEPRVLVCDEVTSSLDVSVEASILSLIDELKDETGLAVLLIAHDLRVVRRIADRAVVLHEGRVCDHGVVPQVFGAPRHELTRAIVEADQTLSEIVTARLRQAQ